MNKKVILVSIMFLLFISVFLFGGKRSEKADMWQKAITEKDLNLKLQYLKEYEAKYGKKKDRLLKFLYLNLSDTSFKLKNYDETIQFGEKSLAFPDIDASNKLRIYLTLAISNQIAKIDIEKAYHYAGLTIELSKELILEHGKLSQPQETKEKYINNYKTFYLAPAYRLQGLILFEKGKDSIDNLKEALEKASLAFRTDESQTSSKMVFSLACNFKKKNLNDEAIEAIELILDKEKPEYNHTHFLANLYLKKDKTRAVEYFEMAHKTKRKAKTAMNIGILIYKKNIEKGIKYFAEAFLLSNSDKDTKAYKYLESLYFNQPKIKEKSPAEQENGFREIINAARLRLGMESVKESAISPEKRV